MEVLYQTLKIIRYFTSGEMGCISWGLWNRTCRNRQVKELLTYLYFHDTLNQIYFTFKTTHMLHIEIMKDTSCPMRCSTCPTSVQTLVGPHKDRIVQAYLMLQEKLSTTTEFGVGFTDNFLGILKQLDEFQVKNIKTLAANMILPIDVAGYKKTLDQVSELLPNTHITVGFLNKQNEVPKETVSEIIKLTHCFFETQITDFQISITNNAMHPETFRDGLFDFITADRLFYNTITETFDQKDTTIVKDYRTFERFDFDSYKSQIFIKKGNQAFYMGRRVMSHVDVEGSSKLEYYEKKAKWAIEMKDLISPEHLVLTLTPLGVRINHGPYDIQNPYLWLTYDELFFHLENSADVTMFCMRLRILVEITLQINLVDIDFTVINDKILSEIAHRRKKPFKYRR